MEIDTSQLGGDAEVKLARFQQLFDKFKGRTAEQDLVTAPTPPGLNQSMEVKGSTMSMAWEQGVAALAAAATPPHHHRSLSGPVSSLSLHRPSVAWAEGVFARAVLPASHSTPAPGSPTLHHRPPRPAPDAAGSNPILAGEGQHSGQPARLFNLRSAVLHAHISTPDQQHTPADGASLALQVQRLQNQLTHTQAREDEQEAAQQQQLQLVHEKLAAANEQQRLLQSERWQVLEAMSTAAGSSLQMERDKRQMELQKNALHFEAAALEEDRRSLGKLSAAVQLEPSLTPANLQDFQLSSVQLQQIILPMISFLQQRTQEVQLASAHTASTSQQQVPVLTDEQASIDLLSQLTQTLSQLSATYEPPSGYAAGSSIASITRGTLAGALDGAIPHASQSQTAAAAAGVALQQQRDSKPMARDVALGMLGQQKLLQRLLTHLLPLMTKFGQHLSQAHAELFTLNAHVGALGEAREQMMGQLNVSLPSLVQRCEVLTAENAALRSDSKTLKLRVKEKLGLVAGHNLVLRNQIAAQQATQDAGDAQRGELRQQVQALQRAADEHSEVLHAGRERERAVSARAEAAQRAAQEAGAGLAEAESQVLQVAEAAAEAQECAADIRVELSKAHAQLAQWQGLHDIKVADMRDAMALQLQTVVSAYSEELAALQGQMMQIEGMPVPTAQDQELVPGPGRAEAESVGWRAAYEELLQDADKRESLLESTQKQVDNLKIQISNLGALDVTQQQHVERLSLQVHAERQQHVADSRQQAQASAAAAAASAEAAAAMQSQLRMEHQQGLPAAASAATELQQQLAKLHSRQLEQAQHSMAAAQLRTSEAEEERDAARAQLQALLLQLNSQPVVSGQPGSTATPQPSSSLHPPSHHNHTLLSPPHPNYNPTAQHHSSFDVSTSCTEFDIRELDNAHQQTVNVLQMIHQTTSQGQLQSTGSPTRTSSRTDGPTSHHSQTTEQPFPSHLSHGISSTGNSSRSSLHSACAAATNAAVGQLIHCAPHATERHAAGHVKDGSSSVNLGGGGGGRGTLSFELRRTTNTSSRSGFSDQDRGQPSLEMTQGSTHRSSMGQTSSAAALAEELSQSRLQLEAYKAKYARQSLRQASLQQALLDISGDLALGATAALLTSEVQPELLQTEHPFLGGPSPRHSPSQSQLRPHPSSPSPDQPGPQMHQPQQILQHQQHQQQQQQQQPNHQQKQNQQQQQEPHPEQTPTRHCQLDVQQQQLLQLQKQLDDFDSRLANADPQGWVPRTSAPQTAVQDSTTNNPALAAHASAKHLAIYQQEASASLPLTIPSSHPSTHNLTSNVVPTLQPELDLSTVSTSSYPPPPLYPNSWKAAAEAAVARVSLSGNNSLTATPQRPSSRASGPYSHGHSVLDVPSSKHVVQSSQAAQENNQVQGSSHAINSNTQTVQEIVDSAIQALHLSAGGTHVHERGPPPGEVHNSSRYRQQSTSPHPEHAYTVAGRSYSGWGPGTGSDDGFQTATDADEGDGGAQQWQDERFGQGDEFAQMEEDDPMSCTDREHEGSTCGNSRDGGEGVARPRSARSRPPSRHPQNSSMQTGAVAQRPLWTVATQSDPHAVARRSGSSDSTGSGGSMGCGRVVIHDNNGSAAVGAMLYGPALVVRAQPVSGAASTANHPHHAQASARRLPPSAVPESRQAWTAQPTSHAPQQRPVVDPAAHGSRRGVRETVTAAARSVPMEVMQRSAAYAGVEGVTRPATAQPSDLRRNMHPPAAPSEVLKVARQFMGGEGTTRPITATPSAMQVVRTPPHTSQQAQQPSQHQHRSQQQQQQQQQQRSPPEQQRSTSSSGGQPNSSSGCGGRPSSSGGGGSRPSNGSSDGMDGPPVPLAVMQHAAQFYGLNPATAQQGGLLTLRTQRHPHPHPYHHQTAPDVQHQSRDVRQSHQHGRDAAEEEEQGESEEGAFQQAWAQQQRQQQLQQVHVFQMEAQAPKSVVRRAKQYSGEEGGARPSTASPSSMRPQHGPGAREPEAPDEVLRMARQITGAEGATDGRPVSAAASSRASNPTTREIPVPRGLLMYIQQYASGQEGDSRPKTASPSVLQPQSTPEVAAPMLVQHMAAQFQAGGEGVTRPTTAPSSDERRSSSATSPHAHPRTSASTSPLQPLNLSVAAAGYRTGLGWPEPQGGPRMSGIVRQALRHFAGEVLGAEMGQERGSSWSWVQYEEEAEGEEEELGEGGGDVDEMSADEEEDSGDQMEVGGVESDRLQGRWGEGWEGELVPEDSEINRDGVGHNGASGESPDAESDGEADAIYLRYNNNHSNGGGGMQAQSPPDHNHLQQHVARAASSGAEQALQGGRPATRGGGGAGGLGATAGMWQGQGWAEGDGEADEGGYGDDSREEDTSPSIVGSAMEGTEQEVFALVGYSCDEDSEGDSPDDLEIQQMGATPPHDGQRAA